MSGPDWFVLGAVFGVVVCMVVVEIIMRTARAAVPAEPEEA